MNRFSIHALQFLFIRLMIGVLISSGIQLEVIKWVVWAIIFAVQKLDPSRDRKLNNMFFQLFANI